MQLDVGASYQPSEDEVWVNFQSSLSGTITIADSVTFTLLVQAIDQIGGASYIPISEQLVDSPYLLPTQSYEIKFRNPPRKMDLWIKVEAHYGVDTYSNMVAVGEALDSHNSMDFPENPIYSKDVLDQLPTGGGGSITLPNENIVVLAPELFNYVKVYDFTTANPVEDYEPLTYVGGGERLLLANQTNQFELQAPDQAPWELSAFAFLEPSAINLMPNPFFLNTVGTDLEITPVGYTIDAAGSLLQQDVSFNYATSSSAKIWRARFTQHNALSAFNQAQISLAVPIGCLPNQDYTFSIYSKIALLTRDTVVTQYTLALRWYDNSTFINESSSVLDPSQFKELILASMVANSPATANRVQPVLRLHSIDPDDDVEISLLGMQLEEGVYPTTRTNSARAQDVITVPDYNAENQKIRIVLIPGFPSGLTTQQIVQGPIDVFFHASGQMEARIFGVGSVSTPLSFVAGDLLDLTIEHQAGKKLGIYRDGQLLADTPLPNFTAPIGPLNIIGVGVELLKLSVFSRRGE
jgi:hypothetical protein